LAARICPPDCLGALPLGARQPACTPRSRRRAEEQTRCSSSPREAEMKLLTSELYRRLLTNGRWNNIKVRQDKSPDDFRPVVKLFCPRSAATWLLTELDPQNPEIAFGLCDLGIGTPELGPVSLAEIIALRALSGPPIKSNLRSRQTNPGQDRRPCSRITAARVPSLQPAPRCRLFPTAEGHRAQEST
jgi:Protein of unknown function (DUF2958)